MENIEIKELKKVYNSLLPHGAKKHIAAKAGVTPQAVVQYFANKNNSKRIENVVLDYISELRIEREARLRKAGLLA